MYIAVLSSLWSSQSYRISRHYRVITSRLPKSPLQKSFTKVREKVRDGWGFGAADLPLLVPFRDPPLVSNE